MTGYLVTCVSCSFAKCPIGIQNDAVSCAADDHRHECMVECKLKLLLGNTNASLTCCRSMVVPRLLAAAVNASISACDQGFSFT